MEEKNPLEILTFATLPKKSQRNNTGGRPLLAKVMKFSPQPKSIISQLLNKVRKENIVNDKKEVYGEARTKTLNIRSSAKNEVNNQINFDSVIEPDSLKTYEDTQGNFDLTSLEHGHDHFNDDSLLHTNGRNIYQSDTAHPKKCESEEKLREISCYVCSHRSSSYKEHREHLSIHKNQPYTCNYPNCHYTCKLSSNFIKHKRRHTTEKPYLCDQCTFRSNFGNSLKVHKRIHTSERPYVCQYCNYRCNSSSNLKKHCLHRHRELC